MQRSAKISALKICPLISTFVVLQSCQLQPMQSLEPTVRIPAKVENTAPVAAPEKPANPLIGIWKSNSEMTLASLNAVESISEESREYLKQNVFGLLTREFTPTALRTYFGHVKENESANQFQPYRILASTDTRVQLEHTDPLTGNVVESVFYFEGNCYYELVSKWQYREYFCRDDNTEKKKFIAVPKSNQQKLQQ